MDASVAAANAPLDDLFIVSPELEKMEAEFAAQQEAMLKRRAEIDRERQRVEANREQLLAAKIKEEHARQADLLAKVDAFKKQLKEKEELERSIAVKTRDFELESDTQAIAFQRMRTERVAQAARVLDEDIVRKRGELAAIEELLKEREEVLVDLAAPALDSTDVLKPALDAAYPEAGSTALRTFAAESAGLGTSTLRIVDTVIGHRTKERLAQTAEHQKRMRRLNDERRRLEEQREELATKKRHLVRLGGVAAPVPPPETPAEVLRRAEATMDESARLVSRLKVTVARRERIRQPFVYAGEWGRHTLPARSQYTFDKMRDIVLTLVDSAVETVNANAPDEVGIDIEERVYRNLRNDLEKRARARIEAEQTVEIYNELLHDVVEMAVKSVYEEIRQMRQLSQRYSMGILMDVVINRAYSGFGQKMAEPELNVWMNRSMQQMRHNRDRQPNVFRHIQHFEPRQAKMLNKGGAGGVKGVKDDDAGGCDLRQLRPVSELPMELRRTTILSKYVDVLQAYWTRVRWETQNVDPPKVKRGPKFVGFCSAAQAHMNGSLAFMAPNGDTAVYFRATTGEGVERKPAAPTPLCAIRHDLCPGVADPHEAGEVEDFLPETVPRDPLIAWSHDGQTMATIDGDGVLRIWDIYAGTVDEVVEEGAAAQAPGGPGAPRLLLTLTPADFSFVSGPYKEQNPTAKSRALLRPTAVAFFPSFTIMGAQPFIVVGLANGNILKINTDSSAASLAFPQPVKPPEDQKVSVIGKGLTVELFRRHSAPIKWIGFVNNALPMASLCAKGATMLWEYTSEAITGFGWFEPAVEYPFQLVDRAFEPTGTHQKVHFTDKKAKGKKSRTKLMVNQERSAALAKFRQEALERPAWYVEYLKDGVRQIYRPAGADTIEQIFHIVRITGDGTLSSYSTQMYKQTEVHCIDVLQVEPTHDNGGFVMMVLFPPADPQPPHVAFVSMDLTSMSAGEVRIDIPLELEVYEGIRSGKVAASFGVSPVLHGSDTDFLVVAINGHMQVYCLNTGAMLEMFAEQLSELPSIDSKILVLRNLHNVFDILVYAERLKQMAVVMMEDYNHTSAVQLIKGALLSAEAQRCKYRLQSKVAQTGFLGRFEDGTDARHINDWVRDMVMLMAGKAVSFAMREDSDKATESSYEPTLPGTPSTDPDQGVAAGVGAFQAFADAGGGEMDVGGLGL